MKKVMIIAAVAAAMVSCGTGSKISQAPADRTETDDLGYGSVDKDRNAYATSNVKVDDKDLSSFSNIFDYLKGRVPGLEVGSTEGGGTPTIRIRGNNSLMFDSNPLILVDGVEAADISSLSPMDVASVDVLKDASAAIYGSRGANGVILIKTKSAREAAAKAAAEKRAAREARKAAKKVQK